MAIYNLEFLNENSLRTYPLKEDTNILFEGIQLPNELLVDAMFVMASTTDVLSPEFTILLARVVRLQASIALYFTDKDGLSLGSVVISHEHKKYDTYYLSQIDELYDDSINKVVIGLEDELTDIDLPIGDYTFNSELSPHCIRPALRGVRSLSVVNGVSISDKLYGNVILKAGDNIALGVSDNTITISALDTTDTKEECDNCEEEYPKFICIKTINSVQPDGNGNIELVPGTCLNIETSGAHELAITDTCSVPCCGCEELEAITTHLNTVDVNVASLSSNLDKLSNRQQQFYDAVFSSGG